VRQLQEHLMGFYKDKTAKPFRGGDHGGGGEEDLVWACDASDLLRYLGAEEKTGRHRGRPGCPTALSRASMDAWDDSRGGKNVLAKVGEVLDVDE
jgi:hypothetical protein